MAASSNDTYAGALEVLMKQLAVMKGLPDANLPFVIQLETQIIEEIRSPERRMQEQGILPQGTGNPMGAQQLGMPPGLGGAMAGGMSAPPSSMMGAGNGGPGMVGAPGPVNPDEMRRVLTA